MIIEVTDTVEFLEKCIAGIDKFVQVEIMIGWVKYSLSEVMYPEEKPAVLEGMKSVLMDKIQYQKDKLINQTSL